MLWNGGGTARAVQIRMHPAGHPEAEPPLMRSVAIDQAAALLGLSRRTIYNRIRDNRLQTIRTVGGSQRVLLASLVALGFRPQAFSTSAGAATIHPRSPQRN